MSDDYAYPVPQYGSRRRPERPTLGHRAAEVSEMLGYPLMPWQRYVADVALEQIPNPDNPEELVPAYPLVSISVGRRAGKTRLMFAILTAKMLDIPNARLFFSAQDLSSANAAFIFDWLPSLEQSGIEHVARKGNGRESITIGGSVMRLFSPQPSSLHGSESDCTWVDETWRFGAQRGEELEVAIRPLMATRPQAQFFLTSAAGTMDSGWWLKTLDIGRSAAERDTGTGTAHFEYGAEGTGLDLDDEETWRAVHPGELVPIRWMRDEFDRDPEQFKRTVLNVTNRSSSVLHAVSRQEWDKCRSTGPPPSRDGQFSIAVDVEPDSQSATIVACLGDADFIEVVDHRPGVAWVVERISELFANYDLLPLIFDNRSPAGVLEERLHAAGIPVRTVGLGEAANAAAGFVDLIHSGFMRHDSSAVLDAAVDGAQRRNLGDGAYAFSRQRSTAAVSPLIAASFAWYGHPGAHGDTTATIY